MKLKIKSMLSCVLITAVFLTSFTNSRTQDLKHAYATRADSLAGKPETLP
jgi:homoaconitase/3-isopropylmalate dehydratase large subunit